MQLFFAAQIGDTGLVRRLLERGADPTHRRADGMRALDLAAQQGNREVVELLLDWDAQLLDLPGSNEGTALCAAAEQGHAEFVRLLLERGADPKRRAITGTRPLDCAKNPALRPTLRVRHSISWQRTPSSPQRFAASPKSNASPATPGTIMQVRGRSQL